MLSQYFSNLSSHDKSPLRTLNGNRKSVTLTNLFFFHMLESPPVILCVFLCLQGRAYETDSNQEAFVHSDPGDVKSFLDAVNVIKPTAIIGKMSCCSTSCTEIQPNINLFNLHFIHLPFNVRQGSHLNSCHLVFMTQN